MHEILRSLPLGAWVLDLGAGEGTFVAANYPGLYIVRIDQERPRRSGDTAFVQADAARLPFRDDTFSAVIANHCLEHVEELKSALAEMGRVIRRNGTLYVAVPDSTTVSDKLYRWIYHGGGHVNLFNSYAELAHQVTRATGLALVATRVLHASLIFLRRTNFRPRPPRRLWLFGNGNLRFIAFLTYALRLIDRLAGTRMSIYGWALCFGNVPEPIDTTAWTNVCIQCGAGHPANWLKFRNSVHRIGPFTWAYGCPNCGGWNIFTDDVAET